MSINLELNSLSYVIKYEYIEEISPLQRRYNQLMHMEEQRNEALRKINQRQQSIKRYFDQSVSFKDFSKGIVSTIM
jgi:prefoldin subunit 5